MGGTGSVGLAQEQIVLGLKEALRFGVDHAVTTLGRDGGFLRNVEVRIPTPETLRPVEQTLRTLGQGSLVDEFQTAMNRAAERAVPEAVDVLVGSIRQLTFADAERILRGKDTEATDFFRRTGEMALHERFLPIVKEATAQTGVTAAYKRMTSYPGVSVLSETVLGRRVPDLDDYVTEKALDGLFLKIAEQEKLIRDDPAARTTELLRKVFGAIQGSR
jgi:hypothetical protein